MLKPTEVKITELSKNIIAAVNKLGNSFDVIREGAKELPWSFQIAESIIEQIPARHKMAKLIEKNKAAMIDIDTSKHTVRERRVAIFSHVAIATYNVYFKSYKNNYYKYTLGIEIRGHFTKDNWFIVSTGIANTIANDIINRPFFKKLTPMKLNVPASLKYVQNTTHTFVTYDIISTDIDEEFFQNYKNTSDIEEITFLQPFNLNDE